MKMFARQGRFAHSVIDDDTHAVIAIVYPEGLPGLRLAKLFAAAPELVDVLRELSNVVDVGSFKEFDEVRRRAADLLRRLER